MEAHGRVVPVIEAEPEIAARLQEEPPLASEIRTLSCQLQKIIWVWNDAIRALFGLLNIPAIRTAIIRPIWRTCMGWPKP